MDQALLEQMTEIYMTDLTCKAAVERLAAKESLSLVEAAQRVAPKVSPAPHNAAAHDARYLLAPEAEREDLAHMGTDPEFAEEPEDADGYAASALLQAEYTRAREEGREPVGPMPPHPNEAPDERMEFGEVTLLTAEQHVTLDQDTPFGVHVNCGPVCDAMLTLARRIEEAKRIPLRPPTVTLRPYGGEGGWRIRLTVDTVPARRRSAVMIFGFNEHEKLEDQIAQLAEMVSNDLEARLMVRRNPAEPWATAVVYQTSCGHDHSQDVLRVMEPQEVPDEIRMFLSEFLGADIENVAGLPGLMVVSFPGLSATLSGSGEENGQQG